VEVRLAEVLDLLELTVTGTGVHCDGEAFWAIRARVELMGGTLSVDREGGALTCRLPLTPRPMLSAG
jgi:signal transduction histidine kinase